MKLLAKIINSSQRLKTSINEKFSAITDMELGAKRIQYKKNMQYSENFIFLRTFLIKLTSMNPHYIEGNPVVTLQFIMTRVNCIGEGFLAKVILYNNITESISAGNIVSLVVFLWSSGLVVKALDSQSRDPVLNTTWWLQGRLSLSSFRGR